MRSHKMLSSVRCRWVMLAMLLARANVVASIGECGGSENTFDCRPNADVTDDARIERACAKKIYCRFCPDERLFRKCQVDFRDCLVSGSDTIAEPANLTRCTDDGGVYCQAFPDTPSKCIVSEPTRSQCFKRRPVTSSFCDQYNGDKEGCNSNGCCYCPGSARKINRKRCFPLSAVRPSCEDTVESCCPSRKCASIVADADGSNCMAQGCKACTDITTGLKHCVYGVALPPAAVDDCGAFSADLENCFDDPLIFPTEQQCNDVHCKWCPRRDYFFPCVREYPDECQTLTPTRCKMDDLMRFRDCSLWGCEWCGATSDTIECQEKTKCTTCDCPDRVECWADTEEACSRRYCKWCENATDFKCMSVNADGVFAIGEWTDCTKTCGCGTRWRFHPNCTDANPLNCERQYDTCNTEPCEVDICPQGALIRYDGSSTTCCYSQTWECGLNILNHKLGPEGPYVAPTRKKRVIGGNDIGSIDKWPWLVVLYTNDTMCAGVLISNQHVLTAACCVEYFPPEHIILNLDTYDRSLEPGIEVTAFDYDIDDDLAVIILPEAVEFSPPCVSPICMPNGEMAMEGTTCVVAGWGLTDPYDPDSCSIRARDAMVKILPWGLCEQAWGGSISDLDRDEHLCAGFPDGDADLCTNDKGGPLMCQRCWNCGWYAAAIATKYVGCGEPGKPTVFTRVLQYESWITSIAPPLDNSTYMCAGAGVD